MKTETDTTTASAQPGNVRGFIRKDGKPRVGQIMVVRGQICNVIAVHKFGTVDVMCGDRAWRVTGLNFI